MVDLRFDESLNHPRSPGDPIKRNPIMTLHMSAGIGWQQSNCRNPRTPYPATPAPPGPVLQGGGPYEASVEPSIAREHGVGLAAGVNIPDDTDQNRAPPH
jgi:hypothetical protein